MLKSIDPSLPLKPKAYARLSSPPSPCKAGLATRTTICQKVVWRKRRSSEPCHQLKTMMISNMYPLGIIRRWEEARLSTITAVWCRGCVRNKAFTFSKLSHLPSVQLSEKHPLSQWSDYHHSTSLYKTQRFRGHVSVQMTRDVGTESAAETVHILMLQSLFWSCNNLILDSSPMWISCHFRAWWRASAIGWWELLQITSGW